MSAAIAIDGRASGERTRRVFRSTPECLLQRRSPSLSAPMSRVPPAAAIRERFPNRGYLVEFHTFGQLKELRVSKIYLGSKVPAPSGQKKTYCLLNGKLRTTGERTRHRTECAHGARKANPLGRQ